MRQIMGWVMTVACILMLAGCGSKDTMPVSKEYMMEVPGENAEGKMVPCLTLDTKENTFIFVMSIFSSYLPYGTYHVSGNILTANTYDGKYTYVFQICQDGALRFIQEGSSEVMEGDERFSFPVSDGAYFR